MRDTRYKRLLGRDALAVFGTQFSRHNNHSAAVADERMLALEFLELYRRPLPRRADQIREILMGDFEGQQDSARIFDAKFISDLEQRGRQTLAKSEPDEIRVTKQHHPPSPHRNVKHLA